ncbi:hypothetical protein QBD01_004081 [Ochrobactrum sp. 19YEA23]|nr:hypothetical protein [Ochrobactrum sp. 19YEA23]
MRKYCVIAIIACSIFSIGTAYAGNAAMKQNVSLDKSVVNQSIYNVNKETRKKPLFSKNNQKVAGASCIYPTGMACERSCASDGEGLCIKCSNGYYGCVRL